MELHVYSNTLIVSVLSCTKYDGALLYFPTRMPAATCVNTYDNDTQCDEWARDGECSFNNAWMFEYCALSCAHCPAENETIRTYAHAKASLSGFQFWTHSTRDEDSVTSRITFLLTNSMTTHSLATMVKTSAIRAQSPRCHRCSL